MTPQETKIINALSGESVEVVTAVMSVLPKLIDAINSESEVWATDDKTWKALAFKALSLKVLKTNANWVHVKNILCVGSTTANLICKKLNVNPDGFVFEATNEKN